MTLNWISRRCIPAFALATLMWTTAAAAQGQPMMPMMPGGGGPVAAAAAHGNAQFERRATRHVAEHAQQHAVRPWRNALVTSAAWRSEPMPKCQE